MSRAVLSVVGLGLAVYLDGRQLHWFGLSWTAALLIALALLAPALLVLRAPLAVWQVMAAGLFGTELVFGVLVGPGYNDVAWPWPVVGMAAFGVVLFVVGSRHDRTTTVVVGVVTVLAVLAPAIVVAGTPPFTVAVLGFLTVVLLAWGDSVRVRQAAQRALAEETERRRTDRQRGAVLAERARIARELHDVVAHHISMIAVQAQAAPHRTGDLPPAAARTFEEIRAASREALTELRRVLGLLREDDTAADPAPQPGLGDLPELVEGARRAGVTATLSMSGTAPEPDAGVAVSVYRVVQEALSNAARHAPGSTVAVTVRFEVDQLTVRVVDSGATTTASSAPPGSGLGLVGMRERVRMLGGTLSVGQGAGVGFEVLATFPVQARRPT
ncbi:sensor histidine kinase [Saccharothrix sp. AJ9571]|nr:sensor histidine kinase [Saccharothrix sp. AJ9571]